MNILEINFIEIFTCSLLLRPELGWSLTFVVFVEAGCISTFALKPEERTIVTVSTLVE